MADMFGQMEQGARYSAMPATPEEQQIMGQAQMRQMLANALLQKGMTPINPTRSSGRYVVPISPLEGISQLGTALLGAKSMQSAIDDPMQQLMAIRSRNNNLVSGAAQDLLGGQADQPSNQPMVRPANLDQGPAPQPDNYGKPLTTWQDTIKNFPKVNAPTNPLTGRQIEDPILDQAVNSGQAQRVGNDYMPTTTPTVDVVGRPDVSQQGYMTPSQVIAAASKVASRGGWQVGTVLNSPEFGPLYHQAIKNMAPTDLMKEMASAGFGPGTPEFNQAMLWKGLPPSDIGKLIAEWKRTQPGTPENQMTLGKIQRENYIAPENFPPGSMRVDPHTGEVTFAPDANTGMRLIADPSVPSGVRAVKIGGSAEIQADKAGAIKGAESRNTIFPNQNFNGAEGVPVWGSDVARLGAKGGSAGNAGGKGGFGITPTDKAYKGALGTDMAEYEKNLNTKVDSGYELVRRINMQEDLLKDFRTGATGPVRERISAYARDLGAPESIVRGLAAGDPTAAQTFEHFAAQTTLEQLKQAIGQNRMLKTEFDAFKQANPNLGTDLASIKQQFHWLRQTYANDTAQQQALQDFKQTGQPIDRFPAWYSQKRDALLRQGKNPGAPMPSPNQSNAPARITNDSDYQRLPSGSSYVAPDGSTRRKK